MNSENKDGFTPRLSVSERMKFFQTGEKKKKRRTVHISIDAITNYIILTFSKACSC